MLHICAQINSKKKIEEFKYNALCVEIWTSMFQVVQGHSTYQQYGEHNHGHNGYSHHVHGYE